MRIIPQETCALLIDVQERLFPHMFERNALEGNVPILIEGLKVLDIPLLVTQQYTKGLGQTIPVIQDALGWTRAEEPAGGSQPAGAPQVPPLYIEKIAFSCWGEPKFRSALSALGRKRVLLAGIETHVCVLQTAVDLLEAGYTPVVVQDCTSSRRETDKQTALHRLQAEGILITSFESILFELLREAGTETFRAISRLVTGQRR